MTPHEQLIKAQREYIKFLENIPDISYQGEKEYHANRIKAVEFRQSISDATALVEQSVPSDIPFHYGSVNDWIEREIPVNTDNPIDEEGNKWCRKAVRLYDDWLKDNIPSDEDIVKYYEGTIDKSHYTFGLIQGAKDMRDGKIYVAPKTEIK